MRLPLTAKYAALPEQFFAALAPTPVKAPSLIALNEPLAEVLGLPINALKTEDGLSILAGNAVAEGSAPLAMAYSGHQFGHWSGQLGDGRAILLGEAAASDGQVYDIQLKGAAAHPFLAAVTADQHLGLSSESISLVKPWRHWAFRRQGR